MLMDDDDAERKKKKKTRAVGEELGLTPRSQLNFRFENAERVKKTNTIVKQITRTAKPDGSYTSKENIILDPKKEEKCLSKKNLSGKVKAMKKNDIAQMGLLNKKVKILGDGIKIVKEKKSARESFVCGACGQLGHMRTNKNCPRYGEDLETQVESTDPEKASVRSNSLNPSAQPQQKTVTKKLIAKSATKIALVEAPEDDKSSSKAKILKVKCGSSDKLPDKLTPSASQSSDRLVTSDAETGNKSAMKVNKIIFSNKKPKDVQVESHKPSILIRPPMETERNRSRNKIIIKRPKEKNDLDQVSQEGSTGLEYRKTKKMIELSSFEKHRELENKHLADEAKRRKVREDKRWWEEEEKRRFAERQREEKARRLYEEQRRIQEEQERLSEIRRYEEAIRREREEEERQKAKKKKKKKRPEMRDDYLDDPRPRRNDRRIPERERNAKRRPVVELGKYGTEYAPPTKRRRGGEVGLSNILESIVETLKERYEVSYLFLKPVSKKEAPDYLNVIKHPMDLSTIKEKVRKMEYKSREEFRHDVWQITYNAHKYNDGRNPGIPPLADQLLELCDYLIDENDAGLTEAEAGIEYRDP
ncbi:hypothetical protein F0562_020895 [Nyssa sinensis]|uniref:Bromo domain-containing protein n=1 Tax=Nyssa sinensis TaxID=561372 RepID=A0A5J5BSI1_9ASTE|nr:hypothetical protein F0562_020895 [Nyssa sinensis]